MEDSFGIRSPKFPYDMSAWCAEKSARATLYISKTVDLLTPQSAFTANDLELANIYLSSALYDLSKLMSFSSGVDWSVPDARDIQENGYEGYQRVAVKYGLLEHTEEQERVTRIKTYCDELSKLLVGERSPNRTFIHDLVNRTDLRHPIVEKTSKLIELVTMGSLDWKDFCLVVQADISHYINENAPDHSP